MHLFLVRLQIDGEDSPPLCCFEAFHVKSGCLHTDHHRLACEILVRIDSLGIFLNIDLIDSSKHTMVL